MFLRFLQQGDVGEEEEEDEDEEEEEEDEDEDEDCDSMEPKLGFRVYVKPG